MGRTWLTFNDQIEHEKKSWKPFRDALRREDQQAFDKLFAYAKRHMAEGQNASRPIPLESVFMCAMIELVKEIELLKAQDTDGNARTQRMAL